MAVQQCKSCHKGLPLDNFYLHGKTLATECKACACARVRARRQNDKERLAQYEKERAASPERRKAALVYQQKRREKYRGKDSARTKTRRAVLRGLISKECCFVCGAAIVEAHHHDYSKPLEVTWVCPKHHKELHYWEDKLKAIAGNTITYPPSREGIEKDEPQ